MLERIGDPGRALTAEAGAAIAAYSWPGNLPELQVALQYSIQSAGSDRIDVSHLPLAVRQAQVASANHPPPPETMMPLDSALEQTERQMIRTALEKCKGNQSRAAELLGIWRPRLIRRIKALGLDEST
jgi:DNA-binding NtrC family response regulator